MVGHLWDMDVDQIIEFENDNEQNNFWERVKINSEKHACSGIDYFVYNNINKNKENYPLKDLIQIIKYLPYYFQLTNNKIRKQMIKEYFLN